MYLRDGAYRQGRSAAETKSRALMRYGILLFLLGLVTGLMEQHFTNMRMGVSAHLEGVMNGIFLLALGPAWAELRLPSLAKAIAYGTALFGTYANWIFTTLGAIFGTAVNNPIASAGHRGQPWQESFVGAGFLSVAVSMITASLLILFGLLGMPPQRTTGLAQLGPNVELHSEG